MVRGQHGLSVHRSMISGDKSIPERSLTGVHRQYRRWARHAADGARGRLVQPRALLQAGTSPAKSGLEQGGALAARMAVHGVDQD
jgi:hypothetical protein